MANRDHKGDSIIDDIKQQAEAYPLYPFFNVDYNLRDRLLYALEGVDWVGKDEDEEVIFCSLGFYSRQKGSFINVLNNIWHNNFKTTKAWLWDKITKNCWEKSKLSTL